VVKLPISFALLVPENDVVSQLLGSPETLYDSVRSKILSLPEDYLLYPAHDYHGLCDSHLPDITKKPRLYSFCRFEQE